MSVENRDMQTMETSIAFSGVLNKSTRTRSDESESRAEPQGGTLGFDGFSINFPNRVQDVKFPQTRTDLHYKRLPYTRLLLPEDRLPEPAKAKIQRRQRAAILTHDKGIGEQGQSAIS